MENGLLIQETWKPRNEIIADCTQHFIEAIYSPSQYQQYSEGTVQDLDLLENTEQTVSNTAKKFLGCFIDFGFVKIHVTSFDAFVHLEALDDCATSMKVKDSTVFAKIREKANYKNPSYELSVISINFRNKTCPGKNTCGCKRLQHLFRL